MLRKSRRGKEYPAWRSAITKFAFPRPVLGAVLSVGVVVHTQTRDESGCNLNPALALFPPKYAPKEPRFWVPLIVLKVDTNRLKETAT
jgi:hypothetical protein